MDELIDELSGIDNLRRLASEILSLEPDLQRDPRVMALAERVRGSDDDYCATLASILPPLPVDHDAYPPYEPKTVGEVKPLDVNWVDDGAYRERIQCALAAAGPNWTSCIPAAAHPEVPDRVIRDQSDIEPIDLPSLSFENQLNNVGGTHGAADEDSPRRFARQQEEALASIHAWLKRGGPQVFCLNGYAGTGKTTLALTVARMIDGPVAFVAFTGKAAVALRSKGCDGAVTIHGLIYKAVPRPPPEHVAFVLRKPKEVSAHLIILDESSMVDEKLASDLLSFGIPVLAMGDPRQLPPIEGDSFFAKRNPDFVLTEVHRQALTSTILRVASGLRRGLLPDYSDDPAMRIIPSYEATVDMFVQADQIIVGRHMTARGINAAIRGLRGFEDPYPQVGDRLVCLRSSWKRGLINGSIWEVQRVDDADAQERLRLTILSLDEVGHRERKVRVLRDFFERDPREISEDRRQQSDEFGYAYALTAHKAQGSQWPSVLIIDESDVGHDPTPCRWLYTAVTRASERAVVLRHGWKFRPARLEVRRTDRPGEADLAAQKAIVSVWFWMKSFGSEQSIISLMKDARELLELQEGIHEESTERIRQAALQLQDCGALQFRELLDVPTLHGQHLAKELVAEIQAAWPATTIEDKGKADMFRRGGHSNARAARRTGKRRRRPSQGD